MTESEAEPQPLKHRRILIVDDSIDSAVSLAQLLQLLGHEVQVAHSGPEAIALARQFRPTAILTDINMPGMDGYQVAQQIRSQPWGENILICAVTGCNTAEHFCRIQEVGIDHHLLKPLDFRLLKVVLYGASDTP